MQENHVFRYYYIVSSLDPRTHYHQGSGPGIDCLSMR